MPKPKAVNWQYEPDAPLQLVLDLIAKYHHDIKGIVPVILWRLNIKADPDGYVWLADITKSPDKYRELHEHDIIIGINRDAWSMLDDTQRAVLLDCQLERVAVALTKDGNPREDDRSRTIYRLRKERLVDDAVLIRRHNLTIGDVQESINSKYATAGAEEGSYVAEQLAEN